jgi:hypothetical protein
MANGLDRLERLFSARRKPTATTAPEYAEPLSPIAQAMEQTFPAPSFLRPTAARMAAREELGVKQTNAKGASPSESPELSLAAAFNDMLPPLSPLPPIPPPTKPLATRLPSLIMNDKDSLILSLSQFIGAPTPDRSQSLWEPEYMPTSRQGPAQPPTPTTPTTHPSDDGSCPLRVPTPPSSTTESQSGKRSQNSGLVPSSSNAPPTPEASPKLRPALDSASRDMLNHVADDAQSSIYSTSDAPSLASDASTMRDSISLSSEIQRLEDEILQFQVEDSSDVQQQQQRPQEHQQRQYQQQGPCTPSPSPHTSFTGSTLSEPDLLDFLNLSDDDIAEEETDLEDTVSLSPMDIAIAPVRPRRASLMTLAPPVPSRPATLAAFEAARIAARYDFDLVYIASLWPEAPGSKTMYPVLDFLQDGSQARPLAGRLLAAHGLHHVPSPLKISSAVHSTILRADSWIEYRNPASQADDLARGYACAFRKGTDTTRRDSNVSSRSSASQTSTERGIVFAAYRKPRSGPDVLGRALSPDDLGILHADAEALTDLLVDCYAAKSRHSSESRRSTETRSSLGGVSISSPLVEGF